MISFLSGDTFYLIKKPLPFPNSDPTHTPLPSRPIHPRSLWFLRERREEEASAKYEMSKRKI